MAEISDGRIWCGIEDKIWEFDGKMWTLVHAGFERVNDIAKTPDGSIWVAADNGLHRFFHGTWTANGVEEDGRARRCEAFSKTGAGAFGRRRRAAFAFIILKLILIRRRLIVPDLHRSEQHREEEGSIVNISFST